MCWYKHGCVYVSLPLRTCPRLRSQQTPFKVFVYEENSQKLEELQETSKYVRCLAVIQLDLLFRRVDQAGTTSFCLCLDGVVFRPSDVEVSARCSCKRTYTHCSLSRNGINTCYQLWARRRKWHYASSNAQSRRLCEITVIKCSCCTFSVKWWRALVEEWVQQWSWTAGIMGVGKKGSVFGLFGSKRRTFEVQEGGSKVRGLFRNYLRSLNLRGIQDAPQFWILQTMKM